MSATSRRYLSLINAIYLSTRGSLDKLVLQANHESNRANEEKRGLLGQTILTGVWDLVSMMDHLREVIVKVPFPISVTSGSKSGKRFQLVYDTTANWPIEALTVDQRDFFMKVLRFTDVGFTQLSLQTESLVDLYGVQEREEQLEISIQLLRAFSAISAGLEKLEIGVQERFPLDPILELIIGFNNLQSLNLRYSNYSGQVVQVWRFPSNSPISHLKELKLMLPSLEVDWESESDLVRWMGMELELLEIELGYEARPSFPEIPTESLCRIFTSNSNLKDLKLKDVTLGFPSSSFILSQSLLPMLRSLSLCTYYLGGYDLFGGSTLPSLQSLSISAPGFNLTSSLLGFLPLLERCCSTLKSLTLLEDDTYDLQRRYENFQDQGNEGGSGKVVVLAALESISIRSITPVMDGLVKRLRFPNLKELDLTHASSSLVQSFNDTQVFSNPNLEVLSIQPKIESVRSNSNDIVFGREDYYLPSLRVLRLHEDFMLPVPFGRAQISKLQELTISRPLYYGGQTIGSSRRPESQTQFLSDSKNIKLIISLIVLSSVNLQRIHLESHSDSFSITPQFQSDLHLKNLKSLHLLSCPPPIAQFLFNSCKFYHLSEAYLEFQFCNLQFKDVFPFLKSQAHSLIKLELSHVKWRKEDIESLDFKEELSFVKLKEMTIRSSNLNLDTAEFFCQFKYPGLSKFTSTFNGIYSKKGPNPQNFAVDRLLLQNAPYLSEKTNH